MFEILKELLKYYTETQYELMMLEKWLIDIHNTTDLQSVKKTAIKKSNIWIKIKWSTIKWDMPKNINIALLNYPEKQNSFHKTNKRILQCW